MPSPLIPSSSRPPRRLAEGCPRAGRLTLLDRRYPDSYQKQHPARCSSRIARTQHNLRVAAHIARTGSLNKIEPVFATRFIRNHLTGPYLTDMLVTSIAARIRWFICFECFRRFLVLFARLGRNIWKLRCVPRRRYKWAGAESDRAGDARAIVVVLYIADHFRVTRQDEVACDRGAWFIGQWRLESI